MEVEIGHVSITSKPGNLLRLNRDGLVLAPNITLPTVEDYATLQTTIKSKCQAVFAQHKLIARGTPNAAGKPRPEQVLFKKEQEEVRLTIGLPPSGQVQNTVDIMRPRLDETVRQISRILTATGVELDVSLALRRASEGWTLKSKITNADKREFMVLTWQTLLLERIVEAAINRLGDYIRRAETSSAAYAPEKFPRENVLSPQCVGVRMMGSSVSFRDLISMRNLLFSKDTAVLAKAKIDLANSLDAEVYRSFLGAPLKIFENELMCAALTPEEIMTVIYEYDEQGSRRGRGKASSGSVCPTCDERNEWLGSYYGHRACPVGTYLQERWGYGVERGQGLREQDWRDVLGWTKAATSATACVRHNEQISLTLDSSGLTRITRVPPATKQ
jgi:hypothetical protein